MTERENRDDIIKRMIDQKRQTERRELDSKEVRKIEEYVIKEIMPKVYEE